MDMVPVNYQCLLDAGERDSDSLGSGPVTGSAVTC